MMSGTSMAAPHVAGLAALIKQKFPNFSPAAIGSALSTTASLYDRNGGPIMAQRSYASPDLNQSPATPFDMGSGFVNGSSALNPGLIFDSSKSLGLHFQHHSAAMRLSCLNSMHARSIDKFDQFSSYLDFQTT